MSARAKAYSGFTLVELMVGVSVVGILLGSGISQYRQFSRKQVVQLVTRQLRSDLRSAQQSALAGDKGNCACGKFGAVCGDPRDPTILGWEVAFPSATTYEFYGLCANGATRFRPDGSLGTVVKTLPSSVTFSARPGTPIRFRVLVGGTNLAADANVVVVGPGGYSQTVIVSRGGEIK